MFQSEYESFKGLMDELCAAFDKPPTDARVKVFWQSLKGFPLEQIKGRIRYWCAAKEKFPTPAQLAPQDDTPIDDNANSDHPLKDLITLVLRNKQMTKQQIAMPWNHVVRWYDAPGMDGKMRRNHGAEFIGIEVPADGDVPGFRVMKNEMSPATAL